MFAMRLDTRRGTLWTLMDLEDWEQVRGCSWWLHSWTHRYVRGLRGGRNVYLHRLIAGAGRGELVDHINGDPLDNRRANLRVVPRRVNCLNRVEGCRTRYSRYRGVTRRARAVRPWKAQCGRQALGYHATEEAAARAYDAYLRSLGIAYLRYNFPQGPTELEAPRNVVEPQG